MRLVAVAVLLLSSVLWAETQADVYGKAMEAEAAGQVAESIQLFEAAAEMDGEYTEEIKEILQEYYSVLDEAVGENPWSFRLLGDVGLFGLHYEEYGGVEGVKENGGDIFTSLTGFVDISHGNWVHSVGMAFVADWFVANDDMPVLDTCDWTLAPGLEYSLVGPRLLLDVGVDFNVASDQHLEPSFYGFVELDLHRFEKQRVGTAFWAYYHDNGPLSMSLYGSWHRTVPVGFSGSVYAGVKYEIVSMLDILGFLDKLNAVESSGNESGEDSYEDCERDEFGRCVDGSWDGFSQMGGNMSFDYYMSQCYEDYGDECYNLENGLLDQYIYGTSEDEDSEGETVVITADSFWSHWLGPTFRTKLSYRFRNKIALEAKLNLFYGMVVDGIAKDYEQLSKFTGTWGITFNWNPNCFTFYLGVDQIYLHYFMPGSLEGVYARSSFLGEFKAGVKFEF